MTHQDPENSYADATLTIDLGALRQNYRTMANKAPGAKTAAVVKANGYGLGVEQVTAALLKEGVDTFFVAQLQEGIILRNHFSNIEQKADIYVFNGVLDGQEDVYANYELTPVLNSRQQIARWSSHGKYTTPKRAALHVDTGMSRLGLSENDVEKLAADPSQLDGINTCLIMSHLACADTPKHPLNKTQLDRFNAARAKLPKAPASLANSAGIPLRHRLSF